MKTIYKAGNITEAHIVSGMLEAEGIPNHVGGHYLQGGVGEIATMDFARVYVADENYEIALPFIARYEQNRHEKAQHTANESAAPESTSAIGIFTKPVLFWVSVFLLIFWFVF